MSKLVSDLNNLNQSRKGTDNVIVEEAQESQEQVRVAPEYKGIYFLSFLMVLLIGFSVISMSISLKTFSQLEAAWDDSKTILKTLNNQKKDIAQLQVLVADKASKELVQINDVKSQINELKVAIKSGEDSFSQMKITLSDYNASIQESIEKLQLSDKLMLEKYVLLSDQFKKFREDNFFIPSTY